MAVMLITLGVILGLSIAADTLARRLRLPRISLLVLLGVALALLWPRLLGEVRIETLVRLQEPLVVIALVMVAFLLGGELTVDLLRRLGRPIMVLSLVVVLTSVAMVGGGFLILGFPLAVALPLAAISAATDPAAVHEVVHDAGLAETDRGRLLLGVVAIDDAWGILAFGFAMAGLGYAVSGDGSASLLAALWEIAGSLLLGIGLGLPAAYLSGRLRPGEPTLVEALAVVLSLAGLSLLLDVSPLLSAMAAGVTVANLSRHHTRSFREIEHVEWPFLVFFFVLAGASVDLAAFGGAGLAIAAFLVLRLLGRMVGGWLGAGLATGAEPLDGQFKRHGG